MRKADVEIRSPDGLYRSWSQYPEMFVDLGGPHVVWEATRELLDVRGRTREIADFVITEAVGRLLYDAGAPACVRSPAGVTDEELARAGLSRGDLEFLVACERMNAVENGSRFEDVLPAVRFVAAPVCPARRVVRRLALAVCVGAFGVRRALPTIDHD